MTTIEQKLKKLLAEYLWTHVMDTQSIEELQMENETLKKENKTLKAKKKK